MSEKSKRLFHGRKEPRTKLDWALNALALGYKVFPCAPGGRTRLGLWSDDPAISDDEEQVKAWWECHPEANIGAELVDLSFITDFRSGLTVLCVDGQKGADLAWFELEYGLLPQGRVVRAPGGVLHIHMRGRTASCVDRFGPGFDVRSVRDYVLLPGSQVGECEYAWHRLDERRGIRGMEGAPDWFINAAGRPTERERSPGWDDEFDVRRAQSFLERAKPARIVGDKWTQELTRAIKELAEHRISEQTAVGLLASRYIPRCKTVPVIEGPNDVLRAAVASVYKEIKFEPMATAGSTR